MKPTRSLLWWSMLALFVVSVLVYVVSADRLPAKIRIATAESGGLYHRFGTKLKERIEARTGRRVHLVQTRGTVENQDLLDSGKVHLAIMQSGFVPMGSLSTLVSSTRMWFT